MRVEWSADFGPGRVAQLEREFVTLVAGMREHLKRLISPPNNCFPIRSDLLRGAGVESTSS